MTVTAAPVSPSRQTISGAPSVRALLGGGLLAAVLLLLGLAAW